MRATGLTRLTTVLLVLSLGPVRAGAAGEPTMNAGELHHALERLGNTVRVLYVAAHPDDENTRLLTYLVNGRKVEAAYLSMTRGGGGQNLIGTEQAELLDVLRTQELLAARHMDGARQFFTRMIDFGYSKSAEETLRVWGHDDALADVVWVLRTFQPDLIITRFDELPPNHGHHTASAILAREAFHAAADPKRFPEQLRRDAGVWQAQRLMHNFATWREVPVPEGALSLDVGGYDPWLGESYGELAARSRSQHRSQGFGVAGERGPLIERFVHVAGRPAQTDLLEGLEPGWARYGAKAEPLSHALQRARAEYRPDAPERCVPALLEASRAIDALGDDPRTRHARERIHALIPRALGLFLRATAKGASALPGRRLPIELELALRRPAEVSVRRLEAPGLETEMSLPLSPNEKKSLSLELELPKATRSSMPHWLESPPKEGRHELREPRWLAEPEAPPTLAIHVALEVSGSPVFLTLPVVYPTTDRVLGERVQPVLVTPPATITPVREAVLSVSGQPVSAAFRVRAHTETLDAHATLDAPKGWKVSPSQVPVKLERAGLETIVSFQLSPGPGAQAGWVRPAIVLGQERHSVREDEIDHPHVPVQVVLRPARLRLESLALERPEGRFGYVHGPGDSVADDLRHIGLSVTDLDDEVLRTGDLSEYRAIIVGIRAYNTRSALASLHSRLMQYVEGGGTVVVQYNTSSRWDVLSLPIGPYPLTVGRERVTDQDAAMTFLLPEHPILNQPNRITAQDFAGWVQERGLYFAEQRDPRYQALLSASDPGEAPLTGGLLVAAHGKGRYVYTGLAFFRQLPAGVPGAYRLFSNLIAGP